MVNHRQHQHFSIIIVRWCHFAQSNAVSNYLAVFHKINKFWFASMCVPGCLFSIIPLEKLPMSYIHIYISAELKLKATKTKTKTGYINQKIHSLILLLACNHVSCLNDSFQLVAFIAKMKLSSQVPCISSEHLLIITSPSGTNPLLTKWKMTGVYTSCSDKNAWHWLAGISERTKHG